MKNRFKMKGQTQKEKIRTQKKRKKALMTETKKNLKTYLSERIPGSNKVTPLSSFKKR